MKYYPPRVNDLPPPHEMELFEVRSPALKRFVAVILLAVVFLAIAPEVHAACVNPAGNAGDMIYNRDSRAPQYCNGGMWVNNRPYK